MYVYVYVCASFLIFLIRYISLESWAERKRSKVSLQELGWDKSDSQDGLSRVEMDIRSFHATLEEKWFASWNIKHFQEKMGI